MSDVQIYGKNAKWVRLSDGSSFPLAVSLDEDVNGIEWRLRYSPDSITREDKLVLAGIVAAYNALIFDSDRAKRDLVSRDIRSAVKAATA